jgi:hypothetical protein
MPMRCGDIRSLAALGAIAVIVRNALCHLFPWRAVAAWHAANNHPWDHTRPPLMDSSARQVHGVITPHEHGAAEHPVLQGHADEAVPQQRKQEQSDGVRR